jgi:hypothetical protein
MQVLSIVPLKVSANREMSCLHHLFSKAAEWELIEQNPFDRGKSLALKENNERVRFLNEELAALFKKIKAEQNPKGPNVVGLDGRSIEGKDLSSEYVFTYGGNRANNINK